MNQAQLIDAISAYASELTKTDIKSVLEAQTKVTHKFLAVGAEVPIPGIGKLTVKERAARTGRNPQTGAEIQIPAKKTPHFSAAKVLKDALA